jgi:hypothetical protein
MGVGRTLPEEFRFERFPGKTQKFLSPSLSLGSATSWRIHLLQQPSARLLVPSILPSILLSSSKSMGPPIDLSFRGPLFLIHSLALCLRVFQAKLQGVESSRAMMGSREKIHIWKKEREMRTRADRF